MISSINKVNTDGSAYGIRRFLLDTPDDLANLKSDYTPGSIAFVISTSDKYMLNNAHVWVKISESSGGTVDPTNTYIWDGGVIE